MNCYVLRWRGGDESLWSQPKFGFPKGRSASAVVGWWLSERFDEKSQGSLVAPEAIGVSPYHVSGSVRVSGVWVGARKLEGELDVGGRRIVCLTGESPVAAAEPAWLWTGAEFELSIVEGENTIRHRGRMVSLLFEIGPLGENAR